MSWQKTPLPELGDTIRNNLKSFRRVEDYRKRAKKEGLEKEQCLF